MHAVIRRYRVRLGTVGQAAGYAEKSLLPQMNRIPGFVAYYLLDAGDGVLASISVCETKDGADVSAGLAADWFRSDWPSFRLIPPEVTDGAVLVHGEAPARSRPERRRSTDRRIGAERRGWEERRQAALPRTVDRRSGNERRVARDRRAGLERRHGWHATPPPSPQARRLGLAPPWRKPERIA